MEQNFVPSLYFAKTQIARIYHDSPVIGAYETGSVRETKIHGPFSSEEDAEKIVEERRQSIVGNEFYQQILLKTFSQEQVKKGLNFKKYFVNHREISPADSEIIPMYFNPLERKSRHLRVYSTYSEMCASEIERIKGNSVLFRESRSENQINRLVSLVEDEERVSFVEAQYSDAPMNKNAYLMYGELYPNLSISILSDFDSRESSDEILALGQIDLKAAFDEGCSSINEVMERNKDLILVR